MRIIISGNSVATLLAKLEDARSQLQPLLEEAVQQAGQTIVDELHADAPIGQESSDKPAGDDAPGHLADSFSAKSSGTGQAHASCEVSTNQPTKLGYVRYGTGIFGPSGQPIRPTRARALYWPGADHPVRSVKGQRPNDFVTPVLDDSLDANEYLALVEDEIAAILEP